MPRLIVHGFTISLATGVSRLAFASVYPTFLLCLAFAITGCVHAQSPSPASTLKSELWWTYLADYDGSPGSIVLDMALKAEAPRADYPKLIVTGVSYPSQPAHSGLPDAAQMDSLSDISDKRLAMIQQHCKALFVGSFTHKNERLDYIYVSDATGLEEALRTFYSRECPRREPYINVKDDPQWQAYLEFLYPNAQTMEFYRQELIKLGVLKK